jgi:TonB family protein
MKSPWLLGYLLNSLWQVPLVFGAALAAARLARHAPRIEHRIWVVALALEAILPACTFRLNDLRHAAWILLIRNFANHGGRGEVRILFGAGTAGPPSTLPLPPMLLTLIVAIYVGTIAYFAARLVWGLARIRRIVAESQLLSSEQAEDSSAGDANRKGSALPNNIRLAASASVSGPVTVGIFSPSLLVPRGFLDTLNAPERHALLAHELAHVRRRDFAKNLVYSLISLPVAYHPLLWLTRTRLAESRELVCDAMAAHTVAGRDRYARSLLRLAETLSHPAPARILHAIGIFDAQNLERRIMNLTRRQPEIRGLRRFALIAACATLALAASASALALRMEVATPDAPSGHPTRIHVKGDVMQDNILKKVAPVYPAEAKSSGDTLNGAVRLAVVIGADGKPENIRVAKSLREDYDQSAIDAVRQWQWKPYLLNGNPVEVDTTVTITYSIAP